MTMLWHYHRPYEESMDLCCLNLNHIWNTFNYSWNIIGNVKKAGSNSFVMVCLFLSPLRKGKWQNNSILNNICWKSYQRDNLYINWVILGDCLSSFWNFSNQSLFQSFDSQPLLLYFPWSWKKTSTISPVLNFIPGSWTIRDNFL